MNQSFIDRVLIGVCRFKLLPPCRAPGVFVGDAPSEDNLDCFPSRNLRRDIRRDHDLTA